MPSSDEAPAPPSLPVSTQLVLSAFVAVAWHNVLWLNLAIWIVFKKWGGLYFYMLLVASWGVAIHQLGFMFLFFGITKKYAESFAPITIGWYAMVTGQSLMLYSRLHLIVRDKRKTRWVLYMILTNFLLFHVPTTIFFTMTHQNPSLASRYAIWEKIQVTAFGLQEITISALYVYETHKLLKPSEQFQKARFRQSMRQLMYANIFIIILDLAIVSIQYANFFQIQVMFKGAVYSVKLLIEFFVLNRLMDVVGVGVGNSSRGGTNNITPSSGSEAKKSQKMMYSGDYIGTDDVKLESFPKVSNGTRTSSEVNKKTYGPSAPVISADRGRNLPADQDKILVVRTVECVAADPATSPSPGSPHVHGIVHHKGRPTSPSSSEVDFATKGY